MEKESKKYASHVNRPGGLKITGRAMDFCGFPRGAKIVDVGCGSGSTIQLLREEYKIDANGIDIVVTGNHHHIARASATRMPFESGSAEGVFMECTLSIINDQAAALKESYCVLRTGGRLVVSDMYALGEPAALSGRLGRIDARETIEVMIESSGFTIDLFEDYTHDLHKWWGQMIIDQGASSFWGTLGTTPEILKGIRCGYFLLVATKQETI